MASPPVLTPGGTTGFNRQTWQATIEDATHQRMVAIPTWDEYPGRILNQGNVRKAARAVGYTLGQSDDGDELTASDITGTPITLTPVGRYVYVSWSENEDAQVEVDLDAESAGNIEQALAEISDEAALANATSLTNILSQASVDATMFRQAVGRLIGNTNGVFGPEGDGREATMYAIFHNTQYPNIMNIPEFTEADVRGDSENPHVKGIWGKGNGVKLMLSTVVEQDGNGWHNILYVPSAFTVGWNVRTRTKRQDYLLNNRIIVFNNFASAVKHDARAIAMRTTASAL